MITQGGYGDGNNVEAVKQVSAKFFLAHALVQVLVGRGQKSYVDFDGPGPANAHKFPFLQDSQQLGLQEERKFTDFVQKNRAAFGDFQKTLFLTEGASERTFLMTKQFALQQSLRQRRAIQRHIRLVFSRAILVNR